MAYLGVACRTWGCASFDIEPTSLMELAMRAKEKLGVPVIRMTHDTGRIVPPNDPQALADAIAEILLDGELAEAMGRAGRERAVERYSLEATVKEYEALYDRLTAEPEEMPTIGAAKA